MVSRERPVTLHVYDFVATGSRTSAALSWLQLGLHHSGVEINGSEYSFNDGGVFKAPPQACSRGAAPQCVLAEVAAPARAAGSVNDFNGVLNDLRRAFPPGSYALTSRNCNHFSDAFVRWPPRRHPRANRWRPAAAGSASAPRASRSADAPAPAPAPAPRDPAREQKKELTAEQRAILARSRAAPDGR
ncbi:Lys63-specific deubiquitinase [Aureococcus anophagefferens]|uniref:Lys63-specific deubiquitinase n=1 Tax=Aureococcus anophagefferens TaxID=44056 RepID=A0ABR1FM81_AURAN